MNLTIKVDLFFVFFSLMALLSNPGNALVHIYWLFLVIFWAVWLVHDVKTQMALKPHERLGEDS